MLCHPRLFPLVLFVVTSAQLGCTGSRVAGALCDTGADCDGGSVCIESQCVAVCSVDVDCGEMSTCDENLGLCRNGCSKNADCQGTATCNSVGECENAEASSEEPCENARCDDFDEDRELDKELPHDPVLYVDSKIGLDSNTGSSENPFASIQVALNIARISLDNSDPDDDIHTVSVADGEYVESLILANGVSLKAEIGKVSEGVLSKKKTVSVTGSPALLAQGINTPGQTVDGFHFSSPDGNAFLESSVAVVLDDASALHFINNVVKAGVGFDGTDGADGSDGVESGTSADGRSGSTGEHYYDGDMSGGGSGNPGDHMGGAGGLGGVSSCGAPAGSRGGRGGNHGSGNSGTGQNGFPTSTSDGAGGVFGQCLEIFEGAYYAFGTVCSEVAGWWLGECEPCVTGGKNGSSPSRGAAGLDGAGQSGIGGWNDGAWTTPAGGKGTLGEYGRGGHGGGGGGGYSYSSATTDYYFGGGGGAGGGAGGCRGEPGDGGKGGGASLGIVVLNGFPTMSGNVVSSRDAGAGGDGGQGGSGAYGGKGADGGPGVWDYDWRDGGNGGHGSRGGRGGHGGGGAGGSSIAIVVLSISAMMPDYSTTNSTSSGEAGAGGTSANEENVGGSGVSQDVYVSVPF